MIFDFDQDAVRGCVGGQGNLGARFREFERVLQQISERRVQHVAIDIDRKARIHISYSELAAARTRFEQCRDRNFIYETAQ